MRVLICGSRDWTDHKAIHVEIDRLFAKYGNELIIIHGACKTGADKIANDYCVSKGICIISMAARWETEGKAAGPLRNQRMIDVWSPGGVVAFDLGTSGTADMVRRAKAAGLPVIVRKGKVVEESLL